MDLILSIFQQLGADKSIFVQFGIITVMFFLSKQLFFKHLQNILDTREDKTVKLDGEADKQIEQVNKMGEEYKNKLQEANKDAKKKLDEAKAEIVKNAETKYREEEKEVSAFVQKSRAEVEAEIKNKKDEVLNQAEQLASSLVEKITKG